MKTLMQEALQTAQRSAAVVSSEAEEKISWLPISEQTNCFRWVIPSARSEGGTPELKVTRRALKAPKSFPHEFWNNLAVELVLQNSKGAVHILRQCRIWSKVVYKSMDIRPLYRKVAREEPAGIRAFESDKRFIAIFDKTVLLPLMLC